MIDGIDGKHGKLTKYFEAWKIINYFLNKKINLYIKEVFLKIKKEFRSDHRI
jgi:hypothetical protein